MYLRFLISVVLLAVLGVVAVAQQPAPPKTHLKVGDAAPDFTLRAPTARPTNSVISKARKTSCWRFMCWHSPVVERRN